MGNSASDNNFQYTQAVANSEKEGHTATHRHFMHEELVTRLVDVELKNCWDTFLHGKKKGNETRPLLGWREKNSAGELGPYVWQSWKDFEIRVKELGSGLTNLEAVEEVEYPEEQYKGAKKLRSFAILAKNCVEWFQLEWASQAYGMTLVPLYETFGEPAIDHILQIVSLSCVCLKAENFKTLEGALVLSPTEGRKLKTAVFISPPSSEQRARCEELGLKVYEWQELIDAGRKNLRPVTPPATDGVNTICFTSGTTGNPKGVLVTQATILSCLFGAKRGQMSFPETSITETDVHLSYLPLPHIFERIFSGLVVVAGGCIGVFSGDTQTLLDDVQALRPTFFISVPRVYNRINDKITQGVKAKSPFAQYIFQKGMETKLTQLAKTARPTHTLWDSLLFNKTKNLLGGRCRALIAGGAPLDAAVQMRMSALFCAPLLEGFGMSETMGASFLNSHADPVKGHTGGPIASMEFRLRDVEEMEYRTTDNPPRGELLIRSKACTPGYFLEPQLTKELFDEDGFLQTGDVACILPTGGMKLIDRKKNIFKLSQGEYIAPDRVEGVIQRAEHVAQSLVTGDSTKNCLVAVVVPDEEFGAAWFKKQRGITLEAPDILSRLVEDKPFTDLLIKEINAAIAASELKGFEKPKKFHFHNEAFSVENDLLTPTFKIKRNPARQRFTAEVQRMYEELDKEDQK